MAEVELKFVYVYLYPFLGGLLQSSYTAQGLTFHSRQIYPPFKLFGELVDSSPYELAEMSLSTYTLLRQKGWANYIALPIFTSRCFRHASLWVRADSDIVNGGQLKGRKVGIPEYHMTAAVWVRGFLKDDFGVEPRDITWFTGGVDEPGRRERLELPEELGVNVTPINDGETLFGLLAEGRVDAALAPNLPALLKQKPPPIRRLFPNCPEVEKAYYRKHGIFPIMHTIVLRKDVYQKDPEIAARIYQVFKQAKEEFYSNVHSVDRTYVFPWLYNYLGDLREVLGDDPFPYGLERNRKNIEKYFDHAVEQSLIATRPKLKDLFLDLND
jgi:4,5-dihydroxyphthalate decarboxylase